MNGAKRGRLAATTLSLSLSLALGSCQGDYPLQATRCDRWCYLSRSTECNNEAPTSCVAACEQFASDCVEAFDAMLSCLEARNSSTPCGTWLHDTIPQCQAEASQAGCKAWNTGNKE